MNDGQTSALIDSVDKLEAIYGESPQTSLLKELDYLSAHYRQMIAKSPFVLLATIGAGGLDCSPRGDSPGFVRVVDDKTLLFPDRRGNNRLDSLRNLIEDSRASLLFLIPGVGETLRINGNARILVDEPLQQSFAVKGKSPATVIQFKVDRVYFQCQKALVRSRLWDPEAQIERSDLASTGDMIKAIKADFDAEQYDRDYPQRLKDSLY